MRSGAVPKGYTRLTRRSVHGLVIGEIRPFRFERIHASGKAALYYLVIYLAYFRLWNTSGTWMRLNCLLYLH